MYKYTKEHRLNISNGIKKHLPSTAFKKSFTPWNKGVKTRQVPKSAFKKGHIMSEEIREKISLSTKGNKASAWKGGRRGYYGNIARAVYYENHTNIICEHCGSIDNIHIHHIDENWKNNELTNLQPLCRSCHTSHHRQIIKEKVKQ